MAESKCPHCGGIIETTTKQVLLLGPAISLFYESEMDVNPEDFNTEMSYSELEEIAREWYEAYSDDPSNHDHGLPPLEEFIPAVLADRDRWLVA